MNELEIQGSRPRVYGWPTASPTDRIDLSDDVMAYNVRRSVQGPVGSFSVTMVPRTSLDPTSPADVRRIIELQKMFDPMDLISIGHDEDGGIALGLISEVTWGSTFVGGRPSLALEFSGADLGKILVQDSILRATIGDPNANGFMRKIDAALGPGNPVTTSMIGNLPGGKNNVVPPFVAGSVQQLIDWIFDVAPSLTLPVLSRVPAFAGGTLREILSTRMISTWNDQRVYRKSLSTYQGSIRGFIESVLDMDFYECWVDFLPGGDAIPEPVLIVRPKPFDEDGILEFAPVREDTGAQWKSLRTLIDNLPAHEIGLDKIHSFRLSRTDADAAAYYQVTSLNELVGNAQTSARGLNLPLVDTFTARRFGMREYRAQLSLLARDMARLASGDELDVASVATEGQEFRNRLFNWYRLNPWFEQGEITVTGSDRYRPGDPVELPWATPCRGDQRGMRYYCHGVNWSWQYGSARTTTLAVVRGHNDELVEALKREIRSDAPLESPDHYAAI